MNGVSFDSRSRVSQPGLHQVDNDHPRMMSLRFLLAIALASTAPVLGAQTAPDSAQCSVALSAASPDSQSTRISILVFPFDTANQLSASYRGLIGTGIHQFLSLPDPLPLHVYDQRSALSRPDHMETGFATLTLRSAYRAMLHRDGHLTQIRAVSGTRDEAFDAAMVHAIEQLGASELLPQPTPPFATFSGDSLDLRIIVTPEAVSLLPRVVSGPPTEGVTPVLLVRLPIRRITQDARAKPNGHGPRYPTDLRNANVEGSTRFEFVVDTSGRVDLTTVAVMSATAPQFVKAVWDALPNLQFEPLRVEGCPAPVLLQAPFDFTLQRY
jgi:TonB family protein